jgi:hypothetical protein
LWFRGGFTVGFGLGFLTLTPGTQHAEKLVPGVILDQTGEFSVKPAGQL